MGAVADVIAAGAVVVRSNPAGKGTEVLLVHRPKYDDWSFPKGKLDPGEHIVTAAVREVAEETGLDIRLGPRLSTQRYTVGNGTARTKDVHYWLGHLTGGDDVEAYRPNDEIDQVAWVPLDEAASRLSYAYDRQTLSEVEAVRTGTVPLVVLRHSRARPRSSWRGDDRDRPLSEAGRFQSELLVPVLGAYGVRRVVASTSKRCWQTVAPYAESDDLDIEVTEDLSEQQASGRCVSAQVERLLDLAEPAVLCTHRPVLPLVLEALALEQRKLEPGSLLVAHHREGRVVCVEEHAVPFR